MKVGDCFAKNRLAMTKSGVFSLGLSSYLSGKDGYDAKPYQEKDVLAALRKLE